MSNPIVNDVKSAVTQGETVALTAMQKYWYYVAVFSAVIGFVIGAIIG